MKPERRHGPTSLATLLTSIGSVLLVGFGVTAQTVTYEGRTILDGVYTASQAVEGADKYEGNCVRCHEGIDPDGPVLRGRSFIDRWRESNLDALYNHIRTRMPADGAGQLSGESYLQILAYMLGASDYPAGREGLQPEALSRIRIVGMDGPQPLPNNTLVKLVGCLTAGRRGLLGMLATATEPARISGREGNQSGGDCGFSPNVARDPGVSAGQLHEHPLRLRTAARTPAIECR